VQLTDAGNGTQLWAEQYDDRLTDIFEVQDRIARRVAGTLATNLQQIALQQSLRKPTNNLDAYDLLLRARAQTNEATRAGNRMARETLEKVARMAPTYADAQGIHGKAATPFMLARVAELTGGEARRANVALLVNNARVGGQIASAFARLATR